MDRDDRAAVDGADRRIEKLEIGRKRKEVGIFDLIGEAQRTELSRNRIDAAEIYTLAGRVVGLGANVKGNVVCGKRMESHGE